MRMQRRRSRSRTMNGMRWMRVDDRCDAAPNDNAHNIISIMQYNKTTSAACTCSREFDRSRCTCSSRFVLSSGGEGGIVDCSLVGLVALDRV
jgi:hypothetical protein